mmetsp:Transcript_51530/g.118374  ORF Transcript_51530/g.118374 Transcript_51530/m.118374 type:complete len:420 (-) Transcript_51530:50-1309(-)
MERETARLLAPTIETQRALSGGRPAAGPHLMLFPCGQPAPRHLQNESNDKLKLNLTEVTEGGTHLRLAAETQAVRYTGESLDPNVKSSAGSTLLIGVYNKATGTVQLCRPSRLFVMHPSVKEPAVSLAAGALSRSTEKRSLAAELGSEKSRKKLKAAAATRIHADLIFNQGGLEEDITTAMEASAPSGASLEESPEARPLLPPHNMEALSTRTAYPRVGLVASKIWSTLAVKWLAETSRNAASLQAMDKEKNMWPPFIMHHLRMAAADEQELGVLLYLTYLLRFSVASRPVFSPEEGEKGARPRHPLQRVTPPAVWNHIVREFSEPLPPHAGSSVVHRRINDSMKHKIALHAHALALWICDGKMLSSELAASLQLPEDRCAFYLRQLGCVVIPKAKDGINTELKLPLQFPRIEKRGRAK